ncbi:hypothetical protein E2L08_06815 [Palleronia sediminis]|uniref:SH3b domain-containing protein n=1 Tax=Palleronia sediminis TaxID=2547833 RepID=A0A4R6AEA7_9RHOB|nr:hypothetical protein [Palleronia sediminis]TDL81372.1 hypothetical protein E2L08_06815 [Palleronia sediminis]
MKLLALCIALSLSVAGAAHAVSGRGYEVCRLDPGGDNFLALRSGPGASNPMLMRLPPRTVVESRGSPTHGKWLPVVVLGWPGKQFLRDLPAGFVFGDYLCPI